MTATPSRPGALGDLRVIDLVGEIGLYAAKVFTNLGAEVIRVEPPGGDAVRRRSPFLEGVPAPENSLYAAHYHAGKRSVTLDLADPADLDRLRRLLAEADVLLESFPAAEVARLGLDQSTLSRANRGLVVSSITPFGRTGPWAECAGTDLTGFASGGMMYLTGEPDEPPVRIRGEQA